MIRNGATDNVLQHLSQSDILRLRNVGNGQWEGYAPPQNLTKYAQYLDYRIRAYRDLKHDPIRVQSENNRDMRAGDMAAEDSRRDSLASSSRRADPSLVSRRQTVVGRKLRIMTVEKGLLRETKVVQRTIDTLLECKFYLDNLDDELTITALRILVKDLLILFQAVNEGVINLLENYFEMSHVDATTALSLYRHFCSQTEGVLEYLTVARKLENILNVPIPNLKHAPVSLAGSLEEYLNDPSFEQNRIEYKTNKESADRKLKEERTSGRRRHDPKKVADASIEAEEIPPVPKLDPAKKQEAATTSTTATAATNAQAPKQEVQKELADFFASIEADHAGPSGGQPEAQPQMVLNPFAPAQLPMATGFPGASPFVNVAGPSPFVNVQATGFPGAAQAPSPFVNAQAPSPFVNVQPQPTGVPAWMAGGLNPAQPQPTGGAFLAPNANSLSPFARPQSAAPNFGAAGAGAAAGQGGLQPLVPQATGSNPFRQSILPPQMTGMPFVGQGPQTAGLPATNGASLFGIGPTQPGATQPTNNPFPSLASAPPTAVNPASNSPFANMAAPVSTAPAALNKVTPPFARPASTPITSNGPTAGPVVSHQTGSKNPFGRPKSPPPPPVPPIPTMGQLASGAFGAASGAFGSTNGVNGTSPFANTSNTSNSPFNLGNTNNAATANGPTTSSATSNSPFPSTSLSSIASEFAFAKKPSSPPPSNTQTAINPLTGTPFTPLTSQDTATTNSTFSAFPSTLSSTLTGSTNATSVSSFLKPQSTGIGGSGLKPFKPTSSFGASLLESLPPIPQGTAVSPPTSSSPPPNPITSPATTTAANPTATTGFGGSLTSQPTGFPSFGSSLGSGLGGSTGLAGGLQPQATGANPFRASMFGSPPTSPFGALNASSTQNSGVASNPTGLGASLFAGKTGTTPSFGTSLFSSQPTGATTVPQSNPAPNTTTPFSMPGGFPGLQQQQQSPPSLI
ncbi:hypothetical protein FRC00_003318 [Tulasnella sp. 408]|nr:hypothetical protein FRC00_003318 [Tulasnella sp. 408]